MIYHVEPSLGMDPFFSSSYLAVDLFFLMSGFVLAHAYESKLGSGIFDFWRFAVVRIIRLYPLYLAAIFITLSYYVAKIFIGTPDAPSVSGLAPPLLANLAFLPGPDTADLSGIFPYVPSGWSLSLEVGINIIYGIFLYRLSTKVLVCLAVAGLCSLLFAAAWYGTYDLGWARENFTGGMPRVLYSFIVGLIVWRWIHRRPWAGTLPFFLSLAVAMSIFIFVPKAVPAVALLSITLLFPLLIALVPRTDPVGWLAQLCRWLGDGSYAIYILHPPVLLWLGGMYKFAHDGVSADLAAPWTGIVGILITLAVSYTLTFSYDRSVRTALNRWIRRRQTIEALGTADHPA